MKGKKTDQEFVSQFMSECIRRVLSSTEEMVNDAKKQIQNIDDKIIEVEKLRAVRCKLLDVVGLFDKQTKSKTEMAKLLPLFELENEKTCKDICTLVRGGINSLALMSTNISKLEREDFYFCIKQLTQHQILIKDGNRLMSGPRFSEYMKLIFHEDI